MAVAEAKEMVISLMTSDIERGNLPVVLDPVSPDPKDPGKFMLNGKVVRVIYHRDGWYTKINLSWFKETFDKPVFWSSPFDYYAFAIPPKKSPRDTAQYLIVDYLQVRDWVLEFEAPLGNTYQDRSAWRADIHIVPEGDRAYFLWADESEFEFPSRWVVLDNASTAFNDKQSVPEAGGFQGGESEAHKSLKLLIMNNPSMVGLDQALAPGKDEVTLPSQDTVDVLFEKPEAYYCVEVKGKHSSDEDILRGVYQCIKYKALLEALALDRGEQRTVDVRLALGGPMPQSVAPHASRLGIIVRDRLQA